MPAITSQGGHAGGTIPLLHTLGQNTSKYQSTHKELTQVTQDFCLDHAVVKKAA